MLRRENIPAYAIILWIGCSLAFRGRPAALVVHTVFLSLLSLFLLWLLVGGLRAARRDPAARLVNLRDSVLVAFLLLTLLVPLYFAAARPSPKERARWLARRFAIVWCAGLAASVVAWRHFNARENARQAALAASPKS